MIRKILKDDYAKSYSCLAWDTKGRRVLNGQPVRRGERLAMVLRMRLTDDDVFLVVEVEGKYSTLSVTDQELLTVSPDHSAGFSDGWYDAVVLLPRCAALRRVGEGGGR